MTVRLATRQDQQQVLHLLNQLGEVINAYVYDDPDNTRAHELGKNNYDKAIESDDRKIFIIEENGAVIGTATFFILTDFITGTQFAHVDDFVIDKHYRGKGYGQTLLRYVLRYAKEHNIRTIKLTTSLPLTDAHRFYEKNGGVFSQRVYKFAV